MNRPTGRNRPLRGFFLLVIAMSVPFYVVAAKWPMQPLPGLPVSALAVLVPAVAAAILVFLRDGWAGVVAHLGRSFDARRIRAPIWYVPILALMPVVMVFSYVIMVALGRPVPEPRLDVATIAPLLAAFFLGALGEELGWSGYATQPMQERWGALGAALVLGTFWAAWHLIPLVQVDRSASWIAWWCVGTVALRVVHVWIFANTGGSVFGQALFHAMSNLSWQLFPNRGSHYDPAITGPLVAVVAIVVTVVWGPRTLGARDRPS